MSSPIFDCCGRSNTPTHHTSDRRGPSLMCTSIIWTHQINGADGIASAADSKLETTNTKKPSFTANRQSFHCLFVSLPPYIKSSNITPIDLNSKCKTARVVMVRTSNIGKSLFYVIVCVFWSPPSLHYVHAQIRFNKWGVPNPPRTESPH
jgi:hypothetical protein